MAAVKSCANVEQPGWLWLRQQLWPHCSEGEHLAEMSQFISQPGRFGQFVAYDASDNPVGFVEVALRNDYVNGAGSSPVAFLEGIYVIPASRREGVARALVSSAEFWARENGCAELASDAQLQNTASHAMHSALGFDETERVVFFKKVLR